MLNIHCVHMSRLLYTHVYTHTSSSYGKLWSSGVFSMDTLLSYLNVLKEERSVQTIFSRRAQLARLAGEKTEAPKAPVLCR